MKTIRILMLLLCIKSMAAFSQIPSYFFEDNTAFDRFPALGQTNAKSIYSAVKILPKVDAEALLKEDAENSALGDIPFRFGYGFDVNYSLTDGSWHEDGERRIWNIKFSSQGAYSLNFIFSELKLISGAELYVFNPEGKMVYGPVTESQNIPKGYDKFLTDLVAGNEAVIQLSEPIASKDTSVLRISRIIHGYINVFLAQNSEVGIDVSLKATTYSCHNDVVCYPEWEYESNAVARVLVNSRTALCSGSLLNNTANNKRPFFLTAFHCIDNIDPRGVLGDAEKNDAQTWAFRFKYKIATCGGSSVSSYVTYNYASFRAAWQPTDFTLVELSSPVNHSDVSFAGWDKTGNVPSSGTGIHHPGGDVMKISFDNNNLTSSGSISWTDGTNSSSNSHWNVGFDSGTTEGGSSGSPLFDSNHHVVGQLHGGASGCAPITKHYGKFNLSWTGGGTADTRLSDWLNPEAIQHQTLNTLISAFAISGPSSVCGIGGTATYTVQNLPSGAVVLWNKSDNLSLCEENGNSKTFTSAGAGAAWVEASVALNGVSYTLPRKNIVIYGLQGTYTQAGVSSLTDYPLQARNNYSMGGGAVTITLRDIPSATYTWTNPTSYGNTKTFAPLSGVYTFGATITASECTTQSASYSFYPTGDGTGCRIPYDPSTGIVQVIFDSELSSAESSLSKREIARESSYLITLTDIYGSVLKQARSSGETIQINISGFRNGIYILHIYDQTNNTLQTEKIVKGG